MRDLAIESRRFSDLQISGGVSTRTLTGKLKLLGAEGLVSKKKFAEFPPRVEYTLTKKGKGLLTIISAMEKYGTKFLK